MTDEPKANILIATVQVPYTRGGAEILVDGLRRELNARGFAADVIQLPFNATPKEQLLHQVALWRALDLQVFNGRRIDLVIATKFPSYTLYHPNKVVWLVHQHRQMYDLYGSRFGDFDGSPRDEALRQMLVSADLQSFQECRGVYTISENVKDRLERYLGIEGTALLPPLPLAPKYRNDGEGDYILSVGRICSIKRIDLIIKALPQIKDSLKLKIVGVSDEPGIETYLNSEIEKHHLWHRVEFLGRVGDDELVSLYANAFAVYYAPFDEDYGFVTLEGLASGKPIVTATDSGGVLSFVQNEMNGLVAEPNESSIAKAFNRLLDDKDLYARIGEATAKSKMPGTWDDVVRILTQSIEPKKAKKPEKVEVVREEQMIPVIGLEQRTQKPEVFFKRDS